MGSDVKGPGAQEDMESHFLQRLGVEQQALAVGVLGSGSPRWVSLSWDLIFPQFWKLVIWCQLSFLVSTGQLKPAQQKLIE